MTNIIEMLGKACDPAMTKLLTLRNGNGGLEYADWEGFTGAYEATLPERRSPSANQLSDECAGLFR